MVIGDDVITVGESAFSQCGNLKSVVMGDSVTVINPSAFSICYNLTDINLSDSLTAIGYGDESYRYFAMPTENKCRH